MGLGIANTPLINYFFYKQSTFISSSTDTTCYPILSISDGGNGQLVITTTDTEILETGVAIKLESTTSYDGNYTVISKTATTFNVSGEFVANETGCWGLDLVSLGANAGDPLDYGQLFFYNNTDKITPQVTYSDRELTIANTNPIILSGNGSWPPIYLIDSPYYVVIKDKFNNLVATLDNYLPANGGGSIDTITSIGNLLPVYGFDNVNYSEFSDYKSANDTTVGGGWRWLIESANTNTTSTYRYNNVSLNGIIGNPKNEIILKSTNNASGQTVNYFQVIIGSYNDFQTQQLAFSVFARTLDGTSPTLNILLIRERPIGTDTPVNIGSINLTPMQTQKTAIFTVPALTDTNYNNNDNLILVIELPLNVDFEYGFTATWLQLSLDGLINITEQATSETAARTFFSKGMNELAKDPAYSITGLPATFSEADSAYQPLKKTGGMFLNSPQNEQQLQDWAVTMGGQDDMDMGVELVRNERIGFTVTNRLIDYLRDNNLTQSRLTFIATVDPVNSNELNVLTGIGVRVASAWASLATPRITVTKTQDELIYGLDAYALGNGKIRITFTDNFATNPTGTITGQTQSPIISYYGNSGGNGGEFNNRLDINVISTGSPTTPAIVDFTLPPNIPVKQLLKDTFQTPPGAIVAIEFKEIALYRALTFMPIPPNPFAVYSNFFGYNSVTNNPAQLSNPPPRVIKFGTDAVSGTESTLVIPLSEINFSTTSPEMAEILSRYINTSAVWKITVLATPLNGDVVEISNGLTSFNLIYWEQGQSRPPNTSTIKKPIYVLFNSTDTLTQIILNTQEAIERGVMGVPRAADLGLSFPDALAYYMTL